MSTVAAVVGAARAALALAAPEAKAQATLDLWHAYQANKEIDGGAEYVDVLDQPGRPERPRLLPPDAMPRRELNGRQGHAALIHALTHIEFTAINLALDAVQRFAGLPEAFYRDWLQVAAEEAVHFRLLRDHLRGLGHDYGDFPAHDGLWELAAKTAGDPLARMALVPRLMEARGLDVTPGIQNKLRGYGDQAGAACLDIILRDEIGHVAAGDRWFRHLCAQRGLDPASTFKDLIRAHDAPPPRPPFNTEARLRAGFGGAELDSLGHREARLGLEKRTAR
jgi:uncharacterized ferritin-like protein (DUF455 family)